jgi:hypothetical protein
MSRQQEAETAVVLAAARLARHNPGLWDELLQAVQFYSSVQIQNLVQSPLDTLPVLQGRAQANGHLFAILSECIARADKIESKQK